MINVLHGLRAGIVVGLDGDFESCLKNGIMSVSICGRRGIQNWLDGASVCKKEKEGVMSRRRTSKEQRRGEKIRAKKFAQKSAHGPLHISALLIKHTTSISTHFAYSTPR